MALFADWDSAQWRAFGTSLFWVVLSFISFRILQFVGRWYLFGRCTFRTFSYFRRKPHSTAARSRDSQSLSIVPPNKKWRISNEGVSLIHSIVSGLWALYVILQYKEIIDDMINFTHPAGTDLLLLSTGYLLHDLLDLLINERSVRILELLFHHVVVLTAFATTFVTGKYLGVVIFGLLMEVNSVFLHSRSLLNLYGTDKKAVSFRIVALLNIVTLMVFRLAVSAFLVYWQVTVGWTLGWQMALVTFFVIFSLFITNCTLAYRVMAADGWFGEARARSRAPTQRDDGDEGDEADDEEDEEEQTAPSQPRPTPHRLNSEDVAVQTPNGEVNAALVVHPETEIPPV